MTCTRCAAHARALTSIDEALAAAAHELGGPEGCTCSNDRLTEPPHAGELEKLFAAVVALPVLVPSLSIVLVPRVCTAGHVLEAGPRAALAMCDDCHGAVGLLPRDPMQLATIAERQARASDECAAACDERARTETSESCAAWERRMGARHRETAARLRERAAETRPALDLAAE